MPERAPRILLVDDEQPIQTLLSFPLQRDGYEVVQASDGREALARFSEQPFDLVVLDLMLPRMDGMDVCRRLRADSDVPIIMLTAKSEEMDRVVGLEIGADDYLTKPFSMRELMARVRALLRRSGGRRAEDATQITAGAISLDVRGRTVRREGVEVQLKPKEFDLLFFLAKNAGQVFTREQLLEHVWGYDFFGGSRTVDVHIRWLREKLEEDPAEPTRIVTVRGAGYRFEG